MRTPFAIALLTGAVLLNPVAHATSIAGNVSCSGELSALTATFGHLSCAGNLSLSDAVVADPIKLVLEASGSLTLLRSTLEAPEIVLVAPHIDIGSGSILRAGDALYIGGGGDTPRAARRMYHHAVAAHAAAASPANAYPIWGTW